LLFTRKPLHAETRKIYIHAYRESKFTPTVATLLTDVQTERLLYWH